MHTYVCIHFSISYLLFPLMAIGCSYIHEYVKLINVNAFNVELYIRVSRLFLKILLFYSVYKALAQDHVTLCYTCTYQPQIVWTIALVF